jgi:tetrahydromethanopterin S-methyltransferase subunit G
MDAPTPAESARDVARLEKRVEKLEARIEAVLMTQRWQMGAAVGLGATLALLLPKISAVLGL